ncbi:glycoside hydrolase family 78 protein [Mucilaginibacter sp. JRF]|uniref:glycoside hydrolase family 78 protein n=1 Tax=Mucilaginibacter sp. JRF TaxID=2780088 RepID=UPI001881F042|nr:glycoside hydrolase family 78 protein [Mucilaginibacter sp. JRF]MBE9583122.1 glycoside hydrolase family 78 protein [Mucilaginibacter sp. JRF]
MKKTLAAFLIMLGSQQALYAQQAPVNWTASWIETSTDEAPNRPAQYYRTTFDLKKKVKSATLLITSHGLYEAHINGKRVGDSYLTPGWTSYYKRLQYQRYDVKELITKGKNAIGVAVGNGWSRSSLAWGDNKDRWGKKLGLLAELQVVYTDGTKENITTNNNWKTANGEIQGNEIYDGEAVDHTLTQKGWDNATFNDAAWKPVTVATFDNKNLIPTENEPVKKHETFKALKVITTPKGEKVIDFGQNLVGWVVVKAKGKAGDRITIQHAEVLDKEGNFYTANLRAAKATASYTLSGDAVGETFEPHFTFYGFRFIKIEGYPGEITPENFTAVAVYSDMKPTGTFECSNPMLNQLQHNITWGQRGNFVDVPTDCPQRDERLGWTGDAQVFFSTAAYNYNVKNFFSKWLKDVAADQREDGAIPYVVPHVLGGGDFGSAGWGDVSTIIPWEMYEIYGDKQVLVDQYESMKKWVGYMEGHINKDDLYRYGSHFGDWLSYRPGNDDGTEAVTDKYQIAQCFFAYSTQLLINAANVLGKTEDATRYEALLKRIKDAFNKEYVTGSGRVLSNTQTAYVLALQFDMLPEGEPRKKAAAYLAENVKQYNNHLTTGFLGTPYLCHVLSDNGYPDLAYTLLLQDTFPSWLYPVKMGATTIWERWDGIKPDGTFQTIVMNSFNHYAYGAIGDWMYKNITGIQSAAPGYKKIVIKPIIGGKLTWAKASFNSVNGTISSDWKIENGKLTLKVTVPKGTTAEVNVPDTAGKDYKTYNVSAGTYTYTR